MNVPSTKQNLLLKLIISKTHGLSPHPIKLNKTQHAVRWRWNIQTYLGSLFAIKVNPWLSDLSAFKKQKTSNACRELGVHSMALVVFILMKQLLSKHRKGFLGGQLLGRTPDPRLSHTFCLWILLAWWYSV